MGKGMPIRLERRFWLRSLYLPMGNGMGEAVGVALMSSPAYPTSPYAATPSPPPALPAGLSGLSPYHACPTLVAINPQLKPRSTNREVLSELIKLQEKTSFGGKLPAYDGRKSLYTAGSLPFESEEFVVTLVDPEKKGREGSTRSLFILLGEQICTTFSSFCAEDGGICLKETCKCYTLPSGSHHLGTMSVSRSFFSTTLGHKGDTGEGLVLERSLPEPASNTDGAFTQYRYICNILFQAWDSDPICARVPVLT